MVLAAALGVTAGVGTGAASGETKSTEKIEVVTHSDEQIDSPFASRLNVDLIAPDDIPRIEPVRRPPTTVAWVGTGPRAR